MIIIQIGIVCLLILIRRRDKTSESKTADFDKWFSGFKYAKLRDKLYVFDVLGDNVQINGNTEWTKFGKIIAQHVSDHNLSIVLISTSDLDTLTGTNLSSVEISSTSFELETRTYTVSVINNSPPDLLSDVFGSSEFVFGLNVWICLTKQTDDVKSLDDTFLMISRRSLQILLI